MFDIKRYPGLAGCRVKVFTRSFSLELYTLSQQLYAAAGVPTVRLIDQTADGYFLTMLDDADCDVAINVDEDCFVTDVDAVLQLAELAVTQGWVNIGCSDAAIGCPRGGNAMVTNPFFGILNLRQIRTRWDGRLAPLMLRTFPYREEKETLAQGFRRQMDYQQQQFGYGLDNIRPDLRLDERSAEPYYPFFFWLLKTFPGRTLYLRSQRHPDTLTTQLYDMQQRLLCLHTWFARFYHPSPLAYAFEGSAGRRHSDRIDAVIDEAYAIQGLARPEFGLASHARFAWNGLCRWSVKVPQRLARFVGKHLSKN